jgi:energy-coupling factor transport system permease protein
VALSGLAAIGAVLAAEAIGDPDLVPPVVPLSWPSLPVLPAIGVLVALLPAWLAPRPEVAA